ALTVGYGQFVSPQSALMKVSEAADVGLGDGYFGVVRQLLKVWYGHCGPVMIARQKSSQERRLVEDEFLCS
ncbi:hypothetical protein, partial [Mycobacterium timonense]|uniref:hypothetical protein n=1 Tax=Mycobacterium timonense TaxID=701043 RepID=UPI001B80B124